jgi:hypothetical protein
MKPAFQKRGWLCRPTQPTCQQEARQCIHSSLLATFSGEWGWEITLSCPGLPELENLGKFTTSNLTCSPVATSLMVMAKMSSEQQALGWTEPLLWGLMKDLGEGMHLLWPYCHI